ncbi:MFS transporter [Paenibacillus chitinolyticus]|uniref:MFS transporter n=1 Tax=Paenibacillus chitinolyticus TaxID=79263 RepID=UPI002DBC0F73|nr:MFS transporter [Paenibacillus chitinolyticus]MEC0246092.1 MFS transporter [Paenibacillus chitinolyticus]
MTTGAAERRSFTMFKLYILFLYGAFSLLFTYVPLLFLEHGLTRFQIGMLMAGGPFVSILANPFWGYWSDRMQNVRRTLIILVICNLIVVQPVFHLHSFSWLYLVLLLYFFFQSPTFSQSNSLILSTIENTPYKFGTFRLWGSLGWAVAAVVAGPVLTAVGIEQLWWLYSGILMISLLFVFSIPQPKPAAAGDALPGGGFKQLLGNRPFVMLLLLGVLISVPNSINSTFVSIYLTDMGGSATWIGWAAFLSSVFEAPVFLLLDRYLKRDSRTMFVCLALVSLLFSIRWLLMMLVDSPMQLIFIQLLHCITYGGYYYIGTNLTGHLIPARMRASGQAAFALTWGGVSGIFAGFAGGWMYDTLGAGKMYGIGAGVSLIGMIGFLLIWRGMRQSSADRGTDAAAGV